jgi:hypothetical protein
MKEKQKHISLRNKPNFMFIVQHLCFVYLGLKPIGPYVDGYTFL